MKAYVFPGQGAQFIGMGKDLYEKSTIAREKFEKANELLGFRITDLMFSGTDDDLKQTKVYYSCYCSGNFFQTRYGCRTFPW
jgi:[acyl-carrier-protein] S-malonyltransferase